MEVLDAAGGLGLHAGEVLCTGEGVDFAEVDDEIVGEGFVTLGFPIGGFLKVEHLVGGAVLARSVFAIGIEDGPWLATWLATLSGTFVDPLPFMELDLDIIKQICQIVNRIVFSE